VSDFSRMGGVSHGDDTQPRVPISDVGVASVHREAARVARRVAASNKPDVERIIGLRDANQQQAEAERERRAKIISAEGEFQASTKLSEAATILSQNPMALQLRYLQTLIEISTEKNSTIVFPLPIDILKVFMEKAKGSE